MYVILYITDPVVVVEVVKSITITHMDYLK